MAVNEERIIIGWPLSPLVIGALCGATAAACWAAGFVAARHAVLVGLTPPDVAFHRFVWAGLFLLPTVGRLRDLGGVGWGRGLIMLLLAGPTQVMASATGFTMAPLGHGAVIQPATSALGSVLLAALILHEGLSFARALGTGIIVIGLCAFGADALGTIGRQGLVGDLVFMSAGFAWAVFGTLLRRWRIEGMRAATTVGALSLLVYAPVHALLFGFDRMAAVGLWENAVQILCQGAAGAVAIFLFTRAVTLLGAGRAGVFAALVPGFALAIGLATIGEAPTLMQLAGFAVVMVGFWCVLRR
ncbi:MAG: DMT family transporter [Xanthobacteraceae bacterium]|jgi:drug/metabolite transporter (DMT)-like permease